MHNTSLAPLLSATFSLLSCCIILLSFELLAASCEQLKQLFSIILLSFLQNFHQSPALGLAQRTGFHDTHHITDRALILFIVRMEFGSLLYELTIDGVLYPSFYRNDDGFCHLV